jgi:hypothetical protein
MMAPIATSEDINQKLAPGWTCTQVTTSQPGVVCLLLAHGPECDTAWFDGSRFSVESHRYEEAVQQAVEMTHKYTPAQLRSKQRLQEDLAAILRQHTVVEWLSALESFAEMIAGDADTYSLADMHSLWHELQESLSQARIQAERIDV